VLVGADAGQDDEVLLSALEGVHAGNLHLLWNTTEEGRPSTPRREAHGRSFNARRLRWGRISYLVEFGVQGAAELHVLDQVGALALVRRDDADLVRLGSGLQQPGGDLLHVRGLRPEKQNIT